MASTLYDPIMNALLTFLTNNVAANTFLTMSRGLVMIEQVGKIVNGKPLVRQPALYLFDGVGLGGGKTTYEQRGRSRPPVRIIDRTIVIYARAPASAGQPGGTLNSPAVLDNGGGPIFHPLIEAVESAFANNPDSQGTVTLGGLVSHCWLEGEGVLVSPDIDPNGQGMATLPVKITVP